MINWPFKFYKVIKIPNRGSFEDLSLYEVGLMIDASLASKGNEFFAHSALDEFLYSNLSDPELRKIQSDILANIYIDVEGSEVKSINESFLENLSEKIKAENNKESLISL